MESDPPMSPAGFTRRVNCRLVLRINRCYLPPNAALAQLVEHIIRNDGVTCSSHVSGTSPLLKPISLRTYPRCDTITTGSSSFPSP